MTVEVRETPIGGNLRQFLNVVDYIYREDPNYVRPLDMMLKDQLGKKNPFFQHGEGTTFTAHRNGWCVGRCTAQIDRLHLDRYKDDVGFFGFFDTIEDQEVANALLASARAWLRSRGMKRIRGPLSLCINEEAGCLIEGFDTPPMFLMPHHLPYQGGLIAKAGLAKVKDLLAWRYEVGDLPPRAAKATQEIEALPEVSAHHVDPKHMERDVRMVMDIFNDAWSDNWGFVPFTQAEIDHASKAFGPVIVPELAVFVEVDDEAVAFIVALTNLNEAIEDFNGSLNPINLVKLLWRLKIAGVGSTRVPLMGVKKKFRNHPLMGAGLAMMAIDHLRANGKRLGKTSAELGWILEDNKATNNIIRSVGGVHYKTHRLYEKVL
jgi:hypothetical protein